MRVLDCLEACGNLEVLNIKIVICNRDIEKSKWESLEWEGDIDLADLSMLRLNVYIMSYWEKWKRLEVQGNNIENKMTFNEMRKKFNNMTFVKR